MHVQALSNIEIKEIKDGSILSPKGFSRWDRSWYKKGNKDLGLIVSEVPATAAAVYTTNQFQAAPLKANAKKAYRMMV